MSKLDTLLEIEGYSDITELVAVVTVEDRPGCPCICQNDGCDYTDCLEWDLEKGWCEECETPTLTSALILMGMI